MLENLQTFYGRFWSTEFLAVGVMPLVLWLLFYSAMYFLLRRLEKKGLLSSFWLRSWRYLAWLFFGLGLYPALDWLFPQFGEGLRRFGDVFTKPLLGKDAAPNLLILLLLLPIFFIASRLSRSCVKLLRLYFERSRALTKSNVQALLTLSYYVFILLFFLFGISLSGINLSSLGVILGALGLGIGFGLQNMAANLVSGIALLVNGHIQHGDFIRMSSGSVPNLGTVERIGLMSTLVQTTRLEHLIVPNQQLLNQVISNSSYNQNRAIQLHLPVGVAYQSDLEQVVELLRQLLISNPYAGEDRPGGNDVWLKGFGASSVDFEVRMMIESVDVYRAAIHWFYMEVWRRFRDNGITIPFPQLDLHVHSADRPQVQAVRGFHS